MAKKMTMSLEDYLEFLHSPDYSMLGINSLNQIIFMHGFRKLHRTPRRIVSDAAECVDLIEPWRSTLESTITPSSSITLTLEDCVEHLNALDWQECCVTSIHTLNLPPSHAEDPDAQKRGCQKRKSKPKT